MEDKIVKLFNLNQEGDSIDTKFYYSSNINLIINNLDIYDIFPSLNKRNKYNDCPFCGKKGKAFIINKGKDIRCFSSKCSSKIKGDRFLNVIDAYSIINNHKSFSENIKDLKDKIQEKKGYILNIEEQIDKRNNFLEKVLFIYKNCLWDLREGEISRNYLSERGFSNKTIQSMELGFAPNFSILRHKGLNNKELIENNLLSNKGIEYYQNCIIIPVRDYYGKLIHLQGRSIFPIPKDENGEEIYLRYKSTKNYKDLPSISECLYGENCLFMYSQRKNPILYITEGVFDCLSLIELGYPAVSMFGINSLKNQTYKLNKFNEIVIIGDNDKFDEDHLLYPGKYKSWSRLNNQIYDLQLKQPNKIIYTWKPPNKFKNVIIKDVNDFFIQDKIALKKDLDNKKENFIHYWKKISIDENDNIESFIKLISLIEISHLKEEGKKILREYLNKEKIDPIDFIIKCING